MRSVLIIAALIVPLIAIAGSNHETVEFRVNGNCAGCKATIENAVDIDGVSKAEWSVETKMLSLTYCPNTVSLDEVYQKIADAGYSSERIDAGKSNCGNQEAKESNCGAGGEQTSTTVDAKDDGGC